MKKSVITALALSLCVAMSGCGIIPGFLRKDQKKEPEQEAITEQETVASDRAEQSTESQQENSNAISEIQHKELIGDWEWICETTYSGKPGTALDEMDHYFTMADEIGGMDLWIYEEDGVLYADYDLSKYESRMAAYHLPVEIAPEPLYEGSSNQEWVAKIVNPRTQMEMFRVTLEDDNKLVGYEDEVFGEGEDAWRNVEVGTYLRKDSPEIAQKDELRYNETITVGDETELLKAIDSGKKIILKEGTYDLSKVSDRLKNPNLVVNNGWSSESGSVNDVKVWEVENLCLMAEEGKKVEICITSPYDPVLSFSGCRNLTFQGITFGHHVEPGTCGGSVLQFHDSSKINLTDCYLYGCGTYGIEAMNCSQLNVEKSEIYECTYGIVDLSSVYNAQFTDCKMHDNKDMDMIALSQCGDIIFTDCEFTNNTVAAQQYYSVSFLRASESYGTALHHCAFSGNTYSKFNEGDVEIDNCSFKDTVISEKTE